MNDILDGKKYEKYCCEYLKKHGFHHIQLTKTSNDQGIDILAYKNHKKYGFQCKYYDTPVGNFAVQEAFTGAAYYNCDKACVITNTTFTRSALQLAEETDVLLYEHIDQHAKKIFPLLFKGIFLIPTLACIYLFNQERLLTSYSTLRILSTLFFLISYFLFLNFERSILSSYLSAFFSILSLLLFLFDKPFVYPYQEIFLLSIFAFHIILDVYIFIYHQKQRKYYNLTVQKEKEEMLMDEIQKYGSTLAREISEDIHITITLTSFHKENQTITYHFRTYADISKDLALVQFEYNQKNIGNYLFQSLSPKTFCCTIENSHIFS